MYNYKCDKCGRVVHLDPGEPRICDSCMDYEALLQQKNAVKVRTRQAASLRLAEGLQYEFVFD